MNLQIDLLSELDLKIKIENNEQKVWDIVRKNWILLTPEEQVRQALLHYFVYKMDYPIGLISIEKQINFGSLTKRYDLVVFDRNQKPWLLVECKAPQIAIAESTLYQLLQYQSQLTCPYWLLSNGISSFCADAQNINSIKWLQALPKYEL